MRWVQQIRMYPVQAVKTLALFTSIFAIGLTFGVIGPTLLDLRIQVSRDLSETSTALPARAAGYAIGSFIMGFVYDRLNIMLFTTVSMGCATVLTALIPHMHIFYWMLAVFFLNGVCLGSFEAACNMMLLHIWGKENGPFMQAFHFFFGVGSLIAPLVAQPFLLEAEEGSVPMASVTIESPANSVTTFAVTRLIRSVYGLVLNETTNAQSMQSVYSSSDLPLENTLPSSHVTAVDLLLVYPYSFVAAVLFANCMFWLIMYIWYPQTEEHPSRKQGTVVTFSHEGDVSNSLNVEKPDILALSVMEKGIGNTCDMVRNNREIEKRNEEAKKQKDVKRYKPVIVVLTMLFMHIYYGLELTFGSFLVTFAAKSGLQLSKTAGTNITSLFWATFTFWRCSTIFYIEYIGNELNILLALVVILTGNIVLVPFANDSLLCLCIGVAIIGFGTSSIWSCVFGYLEEYFPVTSRIGSSMIVSAMIGEFIFPFVISYFVEDSPQVFLWVTLFCSVSLMIIFLLMIFFMRTKLKSLKSLSINGQ